ncbi:MAG: T9SS type A sorting domain-containing protein [Bacteroidota bacterium]
MLTYHYLGKRCLLLCLIIFPFFAQAQSLPLAVVWPCEDVITNSTAVTITDVQINGVSYYSSSSILLAYNTTHNVVISFIANVPLVSAVAVADTDGNGQYSPIETIGSITNAPTGPGQVSFPITIPPSSAGDFPIGFFLDPNANILSQNPCHAAASFNILNIPDPTDFLMASNDISVQDYPIEEFSWDLLDQTHCIKTLPGGCYDLSHDILIDFTNVSTVSKYIIKSTLHEPELGSPAPIPGCPTVHQLDVVNMTYGCGGTYVTGGPENFVKSPQVTYTPNNPFLLFDLTFGFKSNYIPSNDLNSCWNQAAIVPLALEEHIEAFEVVYGNPTTYLPVPFLDTYTQTYVPFIRRNRVYCNWEEMQYAGGRRANPNLASTEMTDLVLSPNPVQHTSSLSYTLENKGEVSIRIIDLQGRTVQEVASGIHLNAGTHQQQLDLSHLPTGMYLLQVQTPDGIQSKRILKN